MCPVYKRVPGTSFVVDAFDYGYIPGVAAYFLSHFHADHYKGLKKHFRANIYCSQVTANLVKHRFGISDRFINVLTLNQCYSIQDGTVVSVYDANHCPGSVVFLFENVTGTFLFTGDMRADSNLTENFRKLPKLDTLYLDTTYMNPGFSFPPQIVVIEAICSFIQKEMKSEPKTLVVCGTYTIGKERVLIALSKALDSPIAVSEQKLGVLRCLNDDDLLNRLTTNFHSTNIFTQFGRPEIQDLEGLLQKHNRFRRAVGIWPSGWQFRRRGPLLSVKYSESVTTVSAPYSEHSGYLELQKFVTSLRPKKIVPTVGNDHKMSAIFSQWLSNRDITQCLLSK